MTWFFDPLAPDSFDLIVADPPWRFKTRSEKNQAEGKGAIKHYKLMRTRQIKALPVRDLAKKDSILLLWSTGAMQPQALDVMNAWGFDYKSQFVWRKVTQKGKVRMGTGYWARSMHEIVLIGTRGKPRTLKPAFPSIFDGLAREHSRKPEEFYDMIDRRASGLEKVDLFSRSERPGWQWFGDETDKFNEG